MSDWVTPAVLIALAPVLVYVIRRSRRVMAKLNRAGDIILGTPAQVDPLSGAELRPAVPDIGTRTATLEQLLGEVVVSAVVEAKAAAQAAAASAHAAELSAQAAREIAKSAETAAGETKAQVAEFANQLDHWQRHDRVRADGLAAVVTELGMDQDPPVQQF